MSFRRQGRCPRHSDGPRWHEAAARAKPCLSARLTAAQCQRLIIKLRWRRQAAEATTAIQASRRLHATGCAQHECICDHFESRKLCLQRPRLPAQTLQPRLKKRPVTIIANKRFAEITMGLDMLEGKLGLITLSIIIAQKNMWGCICS